MRKFGTIVATALVAAGTGWISFGQPVYLHAQEAKVEMEVKAPNNADRPKLDAKVDQSAARRLLAQATKAAVGPNSLQGVTDTFLAADRDRIRSSNVDTNQLDATASQLREEWKAKYGSDLSIANPEVSLDYSSNAADKVRGANSGPRNASGGADNRAGARVDLAPVTDSTLRRADPEAKAVAKAANADAKATVDAAHTNTTHTEVARVDVNGQAGQSRTTEGPAADGVQRTTDTPRNDANNTDAAVPAAARVDVKTTETDVNARADVDADRDAIKVDANKGISYWIPASHGVRAVFLSIAEEGGAWKINLDDNIDANRLASNLNRQLKLVSDAKATWPTDVNEAQRILAHHVASALTDTTTPVAPAAQ